MLGAVYTTLEVFENKTQAWTSHYRDIIVFEKVRFQNILSTRKRKACILKFLRFEERLRKAQFS